MLGLEHKQKIGKIQLEKNDVSCDHFGAFRSQIGKDSGGLGALLEPLGRVLGASWGDLETSWGVFGRSWGLSGRSWRDMLLQLNFLMIFGPILDRSWGPKGSQNGPKTELKTDQN